MIRVGLTGGIGSGKSTVAKIFEVLGVPVFYSDPVTRELMNEDPELRSLIQTNFGKESYDINGKLNRSFIAGQVFNDPEKLKLLNAISHPAALRAADEWMRKQRSPYSIKEAALIFESGSNKQLDYVIGVSAPLSLRIQRTRNRDHITEEEVLKRINRQMNEEEKMKLCDFIVINDEHSFLIPQVLKLHQHFLLIAATSPKLT